jgi:hypothetical protein
MKKETRPTPASVDFALAEAVDRLFEDGIEYLEIFAKPGSYRTAILINRHHGKHAEKAFCGELPLWIEPQGDVCRITCIWG